MNRLDELTDINFRLICQNRSKSMYSVNFVDENGEQLIGQICSQLAEYMEENGLIQVNGENCHLDLKSEHICQGGWIEHLKSKQEGRFEKYTLSVLENLHDGKEGRINKSETREVLELLKLLKNTGIAEPAKNAVIVPLKNRKFITKLIELGSWKEFLGWYENRGNEYGHTTNYIIGENKGIVNQSSNFSNSPQTIKTSPNKTTIQKKSLGKKFWELISENKLISGIILIIIVYLIKLIFGIEL